MKNILTIFGKEFTVFLRDKRTLITTFVLPIVFYYIFFNVMAGMALKTKKEIKNKTVKVGYSTNLPSKMLAYLKSSLENLSFEQIEGENVEKLLEDKKIEAFLDFENKKVVIYYNSAKRLSREAKLRLENGLEKYKENLITEFLKEMNIPEDKIKPFELESKNTASRKDVAMAFLGRLMPYLIIIMLFSGALGFGLEVSTGEKEKGTIATLLVSQATRTEIVLGKLLYVIVIELLYSVVNIAGFVLASMSVSKNISREIAVKSIEGAAKTAEKMQNFNLSFAPETVLMLFLLIIPIGLISAALIIAIGSYAKSMKEGQTLMTPVLLVIIFVAILTLNAPLKVPAYYYYIPVLNTALSMQEILMGKIVFSHFFLSLGITVLLALALVGFSIYLFNREDIHFRI